MNRLPVFILSLFLAFPFVGNTQEFPAVIFKGEDGNYRPLRMDKLAVDVRVVGRLAVTTLEMRFHNELDSILEGELTFPLGEGQTVSRFAMSLGDTLREGVIVEKARGREVFESIVRQQIDPGLLEWTKGNNFRSRVYPIPAKGHKTIVVAYEQELPRKDGRLLYTLPLKFAHEVDLTLRTDVIGHTEKPNLEIDELTTVRFEKEDFRFRPSGEGGFTAEISVSGFKQDAPLAFFLPPREEPRQVLIEDGYFLVDLAVPALEIPSKTMPKKLGLLWDVSGSATGRNIEKELAVLDGYLAKIGDLELVLVPFSHDVGKPRTFSLKNGDTGPLLDAIDALTYDGGTQLGAVDLNKYPDCDEFVLVSDGLSNFGKEELAISESGTPIQILNSAASANHSYLDYLARTTGGQYLNLQTIKTKAAVDLLARQVLQFLGSDYDLNQVEEVYPRIPTPLRDNRFSLAGRVLEDGATITLKFGAGDAVTKQTVKLVSHAPKSGLLSRIWAGKKIAELDMRYEKNQVALTQLGQEFGIVTRNTSLIVLDRIEDYLRYGIEPPGALLTEYRKQIEAREKRITKTRKERLDHVVAMFENRKKWWDREFKFDPKKLKKMAKRRGEDAPGEVDAFAAEAPPELPSSEAAPGGGGFGFASEAGAEDSMDEMDAAKADTGRTSAAITLKKWSPDTPYLKALEAAKTSGEMETLYFDEKKNYANSSAFFLDVADFFLDQKQPDVALRVLSNIAEMDLENHKLLRILGYRLLQLGHVDLAVDTFREVLELREEEPQSWRDLGLALARAGQYQEAVDALYKVVTGAWDARFEEIELIAVGELNAVIARHGDNLDLGGIDERLIKNLPVDIRVVLTWDADATDMDLWVTDPLGEKCFYSHPDTTIGSHISRDFTGGYGPEEFLLKKAYPGSYRVAVNYYGNRQQILAGATTVQVAMITNYGLSNEKTISRTLRLRDVQQVIEIGEFEFKKEQG